MTEAQQLNKTVTAFSKEMREKVQRKRRQGFIVGDCQNTKPILQKKLGEHVAMLCAGDTTQAVDVANLAMFLWYLENNND